MKRLVCVSAVVKKVLCGAVLGFASSMAVLTAEAADAPAFARYADGVFSYYSAGMEAVPAPAGGLNNTISILFASDADYQTLKTIPDEVAKAKGLALEANLTLSADTDWSTYGFDLNGKTLSIAGKKLTVSSMPGTGTITATSANSVLDVNVPNGLVTTNSNVALTGGNKLQVWKTGAGMLRMEKVNTGFGANGSTSMIVKEGYVNKVSGATCGAQYGRIVIEDGAQLDLNGRTYHDYDYTISGTGPDGLGALVSRNYDSSPHYTGGTGYMRNLTLAADAKIGGTTPMSFAFWKSNKNYTELNGHTLSLGNTTIYSGTMIFNGTGTLYVEPGATYKFNDFWNGSASINNGTLKVGGNLEIQGNMIASSKNLIFTSTGKFVASAVKATTVYDWYAPNLAWTSSQKHPTVTLGSSTSLNTHLDLSLFTSTFDGSTTTFYSGSSVTVVLGSRTVSIGEKLVSWGTQPTATFSVSCEQEGVAVDAKADGLYVKAPKLTWKGGDGNWSDTNWLNENGDTVGWVNNCDADFTQTPGVTVNVASDVQPVSLLLSDNCVFTGNGCILQPSIAVGSGITATFAHIGGGSSFDKAGAGTLVLTSTAPATTVNVNAGRLNVSGSQTWSAATVNVANGATFGGTGAATVKVKNYNPANGSTLGEGLTLSSDDKYGETRFQNQTLYVNGTWNVTPTANSGNKYFCEKNCTFRGTGTGVLVSESFGMSGGTWGEMNDMTLIATGNTSGGNRLLIGRMWGNLRLNNVTLKMQGGDFENYTSTGVLYVGDNKTLTFDTADAATGVGRTYTAHSGRTPIGTTSGYTTGKFRKVGAGTMRLYYNMPLTGDATVEGGTLEMNANFAAPLTVAKVGDVDAILKVNGSRTFAGITLGASSRLNCQDGAVGTLTMSGALTIAADTTIAYDLTSGGVDTLAFSGDDGLVMTSGCTLTHEVTVGANCQPGEYMLIGKGVSSVEGQVLVLKGEAAEGELVAHDGALYVKLIPITLTWKGGDGNWSDTNWLNKNGDTVSWTDGNHADFSASPNVTVNVAADVTPSGLVPSDGLTFTGTGRICMPALTVPADMTVTFAHVGGDATFTKTGAGTLVLTAEAPATTAVNVNAGTLNVATDWNVPTVNVNGGILNVSAAWSTPTVNVKGGTLNVSAAWSTATVNVNSGTANVSADWTVKTVNVNNGGLLNAVGTRTWSSTTVNVANGGTFGGAGSTKVKSFLPASGGTLGEGLTLASDDTYSDSQFWYKTVNVNGTWKLKTNGSSEGNNFFQAKQGTFKGKGTLISETFGMSTGYNCAFEGVTLVSTGSADGKQRYLFGRMWGNYRFADVTFKVQGGDFGVFGSWADLYVGDNKTVTFDTVDAADGTTPWTITMRNTIRFVSIDGCTTGKLRKVGAGKVSFEYALPMTGESTVEGGTLEINGNCAAPMTVTKTGTADPILKVLGSRTFAPITLGTDGLLDLQDGAANKLTLSGPLTVTNAATFACDVVGTTSDVVLFSGENGLVMGEDGALTVSVTVASNYVPGGYKLIEKGVTSLDNITLDLQGESVEAALAVREGALYLDINEPLPEGSVVWTGKGADGNWSTAANWKNEVVPTTGTQYIYFDGTDGLASVNDIADLQPTKIAFRTGAGAFVLTGNQIACNIIQNASVGAVPTVGLPIVSAALNVVSPATGVTCLAGNQPDLTGSLALTAGRLQLNNFVADSLTSCSVVEYYLAGTSSLAGIRFAPNTQKLYLATDAAAAVTFLDFAQYDTNDNFTVPAGLTVHLARSTGEDPYFWLKGTRTFVNSGVLDMPGLGLGAWAASGITTQYLRGVSAAVSVVNATCLRLKDNAHFHAENVRLNFTGDTWFNPGGNDHLYLDNGVTLGVIGTDTASASVGATDNIYLVGNVTVDTCDAADGTTPRTFRVTLPVKPGEDGTSGSLRKIGAGVLAFEPDPEYAQCTGEYLATGTVEVVSGTLRFGTNCTAKSLSVSDGARLEMKQIDDNDVSVAAGGVLATMKDGTASFEYGDLTLAAGATLEFDVSRNAQHRNVVTSMTVGSATKFELPAEGTVKIQFPSTARFTCSDKLTLIGGGRLLPAELAKFELANPKVGRLRVEDGNLIFETFGPTIIFIR